MASQGNEPRPITLGVYDSLHLCNNGNLPRRRNLKTAVRSLLVSLVGWGATAFLVMMVLAYGRHSL